MWLANRYLASGSEDGVVLVWDLAGGRVLADLGGGMEGSSGSTENSEHLDPIVGLCWSADSSLLVSSSTDGCVRSSHLRQTTSRWVEHYSTNKVTRFTTHFSMQMSYSQTSGIHVTKSR